MTGKGEQQDGEWEQSRWVYASPDVERESYADIGVEGCIYCGNHEVETVFIFVQPRGLRIAVPGRVGLCATCHRLLRKGDFEALLARTRSTSFSDFEDEVVLDLIRASQAALPD